MAKILDLQNMKVAGNGSTATRSDLSIWQCESTGSWICGD